MDKKALKSYMNNKNHSRDILKTNCFKYENSYLISDTFSIIKLSNNYELEIKDDILNLNRFVENFENNFTPIYTFSEKSLENSEREPIDENYEINIKLLRKIAKIVKPNNLTIVLENLDKENTLRYIIKVQNTKTNEIGYMLPMRKH